MELTCKVKRIKSATDSDLREALKIYQKQINVCIKTDQNQILQYLSNRYSSDREMAFYALISRDLVIGYAEIGIFLSSKVFFIDYFVLDNEYQNNAYFYICYNLIIKDLLNYRKYSSFKYIIMESYSGNNSNEAFIRKCLSLENYKIIDIPYVQPGLDSQDNDSIVSCKLLIKETSQASDLDCMSKHLLINILTDIYYNHYCEWYSHFLDKINYDKYKLSVDKQFANIQNTIKEKIILKNYTYINCKYFNSSRCDFSQNSQFKVPHKTNFIKLTILFIIILVVSVAVSIGLYYLFAHLKVQNQIITTITSIITVGLTAIGVIFGSQSSRK